ncbi:uncharacterized protein V6R79_008825, partial [Siganus canaliculatus]
MDSIPVQFKIDTGADVTVISEDTFHTFTPERTLAPPDIPLDSRPAYSLCGPWTPSQQPTQPKPISKDES